MDEILDLIESVSEGFPTYSYVCFDGGRRNRVSHVMHFKDKEDVKLKTYRTIPANSQGGSYNKLFPQCKIIIKNIYFSGDHETCTRKLKLNKCCVAALD